MIARDRHLAQVADAVIEARDDLLLMPLDPAGNHGDEDVEDHSCSPG